MTRGPLTDRPLRTAGAHDQLTATQLREALGNLRCAHDGESRYTEVPDYEAAGLACFAVSNVTTVAKSLLELYGRLHDEAVDAGTKACTA